MFRRFPTSALLIGLFPLQSCTTALLFGFGASPSPAEPCITDGASPTLLGALEASHHGPHSKHANMMQWIEDQRDFANMDISPIMNDNVQLIEAKIKADLDRWSHFDFGFSTASSSADSIDAQMDEMFKDFGFDDFFNHHADDEDDGGFGEDWSSLGSKLLGPKGWGIQDQRLDRQDENDGPDCHRDYASVFKKLASQFGMR